MLTIESVDPGSPAEKAGLLPGDVIVSLNGQPVRDIIDFQFHSADEALAFQFTRHEASVSLSMTRDFETPLGLVFEPMRYKSCGNHCLFCFIDQNPPGMRPSIYFKDEDYRLSFLCGNYVTLTRAGDAELERIVTQRLSPIYISVHATNPEARKKLLGLKKEDRLLEKIAFLAEHGIEMHGQVVLCPELNDGEVLSETVDTLARFYPHLRTIAVVPVGLTRHREELPKLRSVSADEARTIIRQMRPFQKRFQKNYRLPLVYLADEFYLIAGRKLPKRSHYGAFSQIENGVGLTRHFLDDFKEASSRFPRRVRQESRAVFVTGVLAAPVIQKKVLPRLNRIGQFTAEMRVVTNRFYGESVTVSGLLTAQDIVRSFQESPAEGVLWLPPNCINDDGLLLDDGTPETISDALNQPVKILTDFESLFYE